MTVKCVQHNTHLSAKISPLKLASSSKCARMRFISTEIALETIIDKEDSADGMDSGEESDLDWQLERDRGEKSISAIVK